MKKFFSNLPLVFCLILSASFFIPGLIKGKVPMPADSVLGLYHPFRDIQVDGYNAGKFPVKNPLINDAVLQIYPWKKLTIENFKGKQIPLWNPYSFSGQPLLANPQAATFSALSLLFFVLPLKIAWAAQVILPILLTSAFMYLFLREINLSKISSAFGAFVLPFSGFFVVWLTWGTITSTAMWLPLILFIIEKLSKKISAFLFILLIFSTSQVVFAGHFQTALYVLCTASAYMFFKFFQEKNKTFLLFCFFGFILGLLISSVQLLPTFEFVNQSARNTDQLYLATRKDWFLPPQNLIQFVAPDFFGNPTTYNYWGIWNYWEFVGFVGTIPLALALLALFKNNKGRNFFLGLLVVGFVIALKNPISKIPYVFSFPLITTLQPSRIIFLIIFSLTVLSSFGFDYFLKYKPNKKMVIGASVVFSTLALIAIASFFGNNIFPQITDLDPRHIALRNLIIPLVFALLAVFIAALNWLGISKKALAMIIFGLSVVELFRFGYKFTPFSKLDWIFPQTKTTNFLESQKRPFRVMTTDRRIMHPNISTVYNVESIDGYDPLYLKSYGTFISISQSQNPNDNPASFNRIITPNQFSTNLIAILGAKYILSFDTLNDPSLKLVLEEGQTKVYENSKALPRAFFVDEVISAPNQQSEYTILLDKNFDPKKAATSQKYEFAKKQTKSSAQIINYSDQNIKIKTQSQENRPIIITNVHYPGWEAYIDNVKAKIYQADAIFQLVEIPQGEHQLEFKFRPKSFYNGLYISTLGVILSAIMAILIWRKKYQ